VKITDVRVVCVTVPFATDGQLRPVTMWYGTRYASRHAIVFLETDEGVTGIGEAEEPDAHVLETVVKPRLLGQDPFDVERITNTQRGGLMRGVPVGAINAVDMALWDLIGKGCGEPLYRLVGGKLHDKVRCRYWLCVRSPEEQADEVARAVARGWRAFKIKLGTDPATDVARVRAVTEAVGDEVELGFDLNGAYSLPTAIRTLKRMERYSPAHIEEPIPGWDLDGMVELKRHVDVPLEAHYSSGPNTRRYVLELVTKRAADLIHLNPIQIGGLLESKRLCAIAEAGGIPVTGQSSCAELGPHNAFLLHWITSTPGFTGTNDSSTHHLEPPSGDIITEPFRTVDGCLTPPERPGLGVEVDDAKLARYHQLWLTGEYRHVGGLPRTDTYYW
jgi:L-alanine-DL-glutamate epimerase-like enolase superfamily enzyme